MAFLQLGELAEDEARALEYTIENDLTSFGKGFTVLEQVRSLSLQPAWRAECEAYISIRKHVAGPDSCQAIRRNRLG